MQLISTKKNKLEKEIQEPSTNFALKIGKTLHCKVEYLFKLPANALDKAFERDVLPVPGLP